jgi:type II secretory pathway pseudopilin PulG
MRNLIDFSSWQGVLTTMLAVLLLSFAAVGVRLVFMHTVQRRRERENRQINERVKTLIAAYKTLGGSFTGDLAVDPTHLRDLRRSTGTPEAAAEAASSSGSDRRRRMRDAVEAALSDIILLGTEEQVRLAVQAANDMVAGRRVETAALVSALRKFIREVLDLEPVPAELVIPQQGPLRPGGSASPRTGRNDRGGAGGRGGGNAQGGGSGAIAGAAGLGSAHEDG